MVDIGSLEPGEPVEAELAVRAVRGVKPYAKGFFLTLELGDASGSLPAKVWLGPDEDAARELDEAIDVGDVVRVDGRTTEYRGRLELAVETPPEIVDGGEVDPRDYLPAADTHLGRKLLDLLARARSIEDEPLRELVLSLWTDEELQRRLVAAPATKSHHRSWLGGLLEHAHTLVRLADELTRCAHGLDRDLLLAGALLKPLGALDELDWAAAIEITDAGRLIGPAALADDRLAAAIDDADLEPERALRLRHLVQAAHAGEGYGPGAPRTPEAVALAAIDRLDVRVARALKGARELVEDGEQAGWPDGYGGYLDVGERHLASGESG